MVATLIQIARRHLVGIAADAANAADAAPAAAADVANGDHADVLAGCASGLRNISLHPEQRRQIVHLGGLSVLLEAAERCESAREVQEGVAGFLNLMAGDISLAKGAEGASGSGTYRGASHDAVTTATAAAEEAEQEEVTLLRRILRVLLRAMACHPKAAAVQREVASTLKNMMVSDSVGRQVGGSSVVARLICELEGVDALLAVCADEELAADAKLQVAAVWALWGLASLHEASQEEIAAKAGIEALVAVAEQHTTQKAEHIQLHERVCALLNRLSAQQKREIWQAGGVRMLIRSAHEFYPTNAKISQRVVNILSNLIVDDQIEEAIVKGKGIEACVAAARAHQDDAKVQTCVAYAFANLTASKASHPRKVYLAKAGAIKTLVDACKRHSDSAELMLGVTHALWHLSALLESAQLVVKEKAIAPFLAALHAHTQGWHATIESDQPRRLQLMDGVVQVLRCACRSRCADLALMLRAVLLLHTTNLAGSRHANNAQEPLALSEWARGARRGQWAAAARPRRRPRGAL